MISPGDAQTDLPRILPGSLSPYHVGRLISASRSRDYNVASCHLPIWLLDVEKFRFARFALSQAQQQAGCLLPDTMRRRRDEDGNGSIEPTPADDPTWLLNAARQIARAGDYGLPFLHRRQSRFQVATSLRHEQSVDAHDEPEAVCAWHLPRLLALLACEAGMPVDACAPSREREQRGGGHAEE